MTRIDRYVVTMILGFTLIVALAMTSIYTLTTFVSDLDDTGTGNFGLFQLVVYTALNLPTGLHIMLPMIALLGALLALGQLAGNGELTAMRAAGLSNARLGVAVAMAGLAIGIFGWLLGDWIAPAGTETAERLRTEARYGDTAGASLRPVWIRDGDQIFFVRKVISERSVQNVIIYTLKDFHLVRVASVASAQFRDGHWTLHDVKATILDGAKSDVASVAEMSRGDGPSPDVLKLFILQADSLSVRGLIRLISFMEDNGLDVSNQRLSLWQKLVSPFTVVVLTVFAVPFVFGSLRDSGAGLRLLVGVLLGVGFWVVNDMTASFGLLYGWPPLLAASLPTILMGAFAGWRLARTR